MEALKKLVSDDLLKRRDALAEADLRAANAQTSLDEAQANARRERDEYEQLKAWLDAQP